MKVVMGVSLLSAFRISRYLLVSCLLSSGSLLLAQTQPPSSAPPPAADTSNSDKPIAAAARDGKSEKTLHAKKVFTDDDMDVMAGPLPPIQMQGADKGDAIVAAISKYKRSHTPEETETAVHSWYDRYDQMLVAAYRENSEISSLFNVNVSNGNEFCQQSQNYEQCQSRQLAEQHGIRSDQNRLSKNTALIMRIHEVFGLVRGELWVQNLRYSWFKIHTSANGDEI